MREYSHPFEQRKGGAPASQERTSGRTGRLCGGNSGQTGRSVLLRLEDGEFDAEEFLGVLAKFADEQAEVAGEPG